MTAEHPIAADGHRARMADYADRSRDLYGHLADDELEARLEAAGILHSHARFVVEHREDPEVAAWIKRYVDAA